MISIAIKPDYPAEGQVADGISYDYGDKTGSLVAAPPEPAGFDYLTLPPQPTGFNYG